MRYLSLILVFCLALTGPALAQSQKTDIRPDANRIVGEDLLDDFKGITFNGAYNFTDDGEPRRFYTETHHDDGRVTYSEDGETFDGVWTIRRDNMCYVYRGDAMTGGCFRVYKVGNCFYFYSDMFMPRRDELDQDYWTARSTKDGERAQCQPGLS